MAERGADSLAGHVNPLHWFFISLGSSSSFSCCLWVEVQLFIFQTSNPSASVWKSIIYRVKSVAGAGKRRDSSHQVPGVRWQKTADSSVSRSLSWDLMWQWHRTKPRDGMREEDKAKKKIIINTAGNWKIRFFHQVHLKMPEKKAKPGMHGQIVGLKSCALRKELWGKKGETGRKERWGNIKKLNSCL